MSTANSENNNDPEIILSAGDFRLRVAPFGASLRGMWLERGGKKREVITGYSGRENKVGGQGDVLIPFPGRVRDGKYRFGRRDYQLECNDKDGPNAIHGFVRSKMWEITVQTADAVTFATTIKPDDHPGYPFDLRVEVSYALDAEDGMTCRFEVENVGDAFAPVGVGFHPYLTIGSETIDNDILSVDMTEMLEFENLLPTGDVLSVEETPYDFSGVPQRIGKTRFNTCFTTPKRDEERTSVHLLYRGDENRALAVWMDESFPYVVLYSGDPLPETHRRRALAIEPMTCGTDAFNYYEFGLKTLAPDQIFTGSWGVWAETAKGDWVKTA